MLRSTKILLQFASLLTVSSAIAQPQIAYLLPDLGTPGRNTYIEIVAPANSFGTFGADGIYLDNPGDPLRVVTVLNVDSNQIKFGPVVVSHNGRLISTQLFVKPGVAPNSSDWEALQPKFRIPIHVVLNGQSSNSDTIYIIQPWPAIQRNSPATLGSGGILGKRSRRGAMIVQSLNLSGGTFDVSTSDCDPATPGNQGYLPATIISIGDVTLSKDARMSVSASGSDGGPGGGGGGARFDDDWSGGTNTAAGNGFTGGEGTPYESGGISSGSPWAMSIGGSSLNGVAGPQDVQGSDPYGGGGSRLGGQGTGGGTGYCFGTSGSGNRTSNCSISNVVGGFGGGSGASECYPTAYGGGGGGFGTDGKDFAGGHGHANGNAMLVPLAGGSGGAGGNPWDGMAGAGGGGGGSLALHSFTSVTISSVTSDGSNGADQTLQQEGHFSGAGAGGSGGGVLCTGKLESTVQSASLVGGKGGNVNVVNTSEGNVQFGGEGGQGRVRYDAPHSLQPVITYGASQYRGPSTDTSHFVHRTFNLTGTGNGNPIRIYLAGENLPWRLLATVTGYTNNACSYLTNLPGTDTLYYLVAAQEVSSPNTTAYLEEPQFVQSQAAANLLVVGGECADFVLMDPQGIRRGHLNESISYPIHTEFRRTLNSDSLLSNTLKLHYALTFDSSELEVLSVSPPGGWGIRSQQVAGGLLDIDLARSSVSTHSLDSLGSVLFNVIGATKKHIILELSKFEITDSSQTLPFCIYESEGSSWVILLDSGIARVAARGDGMSVSEVYPNPTREMAEITLELESPQTVSLKAYDILGRPMTSMSQSLKARRGSNTIRLSTDGFRQGMYFLRIQHGSSVVTREFRVAN